MHKLFYYIIYFSIDIVEVCVHTEFLNLSSAVPLKNINSHGNCTKSPFFTETLSIKSIISLNKKVFHRNKFQSVY